MSATYTLRHTDGTTLVDITSLESNGVGNQSTPRRILDIDFSTVPPAFVVGDDATARFVPGFSFEVFDSAYTGVYTVAPAGATFLDGVTKIPVVEPIAINSYPIVGVSDTADYWEVASAGNDIDIFFPSSTFTVAANGLAGANIVYTVVSASTVSPTTTRINVTPGSVPTGATASGYGATSTPAQFAFSAPPAIVLSSPNTFDITWRIAGDHTSRFTVGGRFNIKDNSYFDYHVFVITAKSFSGGNTHVTGRINSPVTPTPDSSGFLIHPIAATQTGYIQYEVQPVATSLQLMGKGAPYFNNETTWGHALMNNAIHQLEHHADDVPPTAPLQGQLWYDQSVDQHRALAPTTIHHNITAVNSGTKTFTVAGDHTTAVELQAGQKIEVYNNIGLGVENHEFTVASIALNAGNTNIVVVEAVPATVTATGKLYGRHLWNGLVTATIPTTNYVDMNGHPIIHVQDIPAAHEYTVIGGDTPFDNDFQSNALNLRSANEIFVNVTGDTMTGDLTMATGVDINMTDGNIYMNAASALQFPVGSTGDINMAGDNTLNFPVGSNGDILLNGANDVMVAGSGRVDFANNEQRMNGTSFISFPAGSTGDVILSGDNTVNFPVGSNGDILLNGANDVMVAGSGRVDFANNEQRMNGTSFINFPAGSTGDIILSGANDVMVAGAGRVDLANNEQRMNGTSFLNFPVGSTGDVTLQGANDIVFSGTGIINMGNNKITNLANATVGTDALNMQTGDGRYVNVTGDSMSGALSMTSANITMTGTSTLQFTGTGQVDMGMNKVVNLGAPVSGTDATNKAYVDAFVSGIVFLTPVKDPNVYNDTLAKPPVSPQPYHHTYLVKPAAYTITGRTTGASGTWIISGNHAPLFAAGDTFTVDGNSDGPSNGTYTVASAADVSATTEITITGTVPASAGTNGTVYHSQDAWNGLDGRAVVWNGTAWIDILGRAVQSGDRFGVYMEPDNDEVPIDTSGMGAVLIPAAGKVGTIQAVVTAPGFTALGTAPAWSFYTPVEPDAVSVTGQDSLHFGHSYTFRGTYGTGTYNSAHKWIEFSGPTAVIDGAGLKFTGNTLNIGAGTGIIVGADTVSVDPSFIASAVTLDIEINTTTKNISTTTTGWDGDAANYGIPAAAIGIHNVSLGRAALHTLTTGNNNIAVGAYSLYSNTTGDTNIALGTSSLYSNTTGYNNIAIGGTSLRYNTTGYGNIAVGDGALSNNTSGISNIAYGTGSLRDTTTGYRNVGAGELSMYRNTTGYTNTAFGFAALGNNTTGFSNVAIGAGAGYSLTTGNNNVLIGGYAGSAGMDGNIVLSTGNGTVRFQHDGTLWTSATPISTTGLILPSTTSPITLNASVGTAGQVLTSAGPGATPTWTTPSNATADPDIDINLTTKSISTTPSGWNSVAVDYGIPATSTGTDNVSIGRAALHSNTTGSDNIATGGYALSSNTTGSGNIATGSNTLFSNTTGNRNIATGSNALRSNTIGYDNIATGVSALSSNTFGFRNIASGTDALYSNTTGTNNIATGVSALSSNTTGSDNVATSGNALRSNTTGNRNIATGVNTLYSNTTGSGNIATGGYALSSNTTGSGNTATGGYALGSNTTGFDNVATGYGALYTNTTGSGNIATGGYALYSNTTGSGNVATGGNALYSNTTGFDNVATGGNALYSNTTGTNNVAVGVNAGDDAVATLTTQSNYVVLGNNSTTNANIKVAWTVTSDSRDKGSIEPLPLGINFVNQMQPKQFTLIDRETGEATTGLRYGFIAQDILTLESAPVLVDATDDDNLKLKESMIVPILVKAMQELSAALAEEKAIRASLISRIEALENKE